MEHKQRTKMPASQRSKQFMPFSAVKGLEKAIVEQEHILNGVEPIELSEEQVLSINSQLNDIEKGDMVSVCFYSNGQRKFLQGIVETFRPQEGIIRIVDIVDIVVSFQNVLGIKRLLR